MAGRSTASSTSAGRRRRNSGSIPGFYSAEVSIIVNKRKWDGLTDEQRAVLTRAGEALEANYADVAKENAAEAEKQKAAGIQVIKLEGEAAEAWRKKAYEAGWAGVVKQSPEHGPKLKELFSKAP